MKTCKVCGLPPRTRKAIDRALVEGMPVERVAERFKRKVSRSGVYRHSKHVLAATPESRRLQQGQVVMEGKSLLDRTEQLIAEHQALAETAKATGQIIAAVSALREIRANLELMGKLSGELFSANVNFFAMELTKERISDFIEAAASRPPDVGQFVRDQAMKRFGAVAPAISINFVSPPTRDALGNLVVPALPQPTTSS
jgi:hypothetical protein